MGVESQETEGEEIELGFTSIKCPSATLFSSAIRDCTGASIQSSRLSAAVMTGAFPSPPLGGFDVIGVAS